MSGDLVSIWRQALILLVGASAAISSIAAAADFQRSPNLCVLPVLRGSPGEVDLFGPGRTINRPTVLPGLSGPILYGNRGGTWTVVNGLYQPYGGEFPQSPIYDRFAVDGDSGRIIGLGIGGKIYSAEPDTRAFHRLASLDDSGRRAAGALAYAAHRHTIMFAYDHSLYRLDGDKPILATDKLPFSVGYLGTIADLPKQKAVLVSNGEGDIAFVHDDNIIDVVMHKLIKGSDQFVRAAIETGDPVHVLVRTFREMLIVDATRPAAERVQAVSFPAGIFYAFSEFVGSFATGTYIVDGRGLERLGPNGPEPFSDGTPIAQRARRIITLSSLGGIALIPEKEAIYVFDGHTLSAIPDSGWEVAGTMIDVKNIASIGKVLVNTTKGLFELTPQHTLVPIALPVNGSGIKIEEMAQSHAAILLVARSAYAIGQDGVVSTLPGGDDMGLSSGLGSQPIGVLSPSNELLFEGPGLTSLYRVVDRRSEGVAACGAPL